MEPQFVYVPLDSDDPTRPTGNYISLEDIAHVVTHGEGEQLHVHVHLKCGEGRSFSGESARVLVEYLDRWTYKPVEKPKRYRQELHRV